jgi:hypothetical protein
MNHSPFKLTYALGTIPRIVLVIIERRRFGNWFPFRHEGSFRWILHLSTMLQQLSTSYSKCVRLKLVSLKNKRYS